MWWYPSVITELLKCDGGQEQEMAQELVEDPALSKKQGRDERDSTSASSRARTDA